MSLAELSLQSNTRADSRPFHSARSVEFSSEALRASSTAVRFGGTSVVCALTVEKVNTRT